MALGLCRQVSCCLSIAVDEDQTGDNERKHPNEEVDYIVFSSAGAVKLTSVVPSMESMVVPEVTDDTWTEVSLPKAYVSPIAVCTVVYVGKGLLPPWSA
jgi:hypothetical protein